MGDIWLSTLRSLRAHPVRFGLLTLRATSSIFLNRTHDLPISSFLPVVNHAA